MCVPDAKPVVRPVWVRGWLGGNGGRGVLRCRCTAQRDHNGAGPGFSVAWHCADWRRGPVRPARLRDTAERTARLQQITVFPGAGMVRARVEGSPLTAAAGLAWSGALPRQLQQVLFGTADSILF
jgi:hypothetical protein